jgi:BirA family biotin operon repressor/biotin-[acetyl-CoA-carboxylase] ligase
MTPPFHYFERVGSTMDVIHRLAEEGAEVGTAVMAGEQLEGRGSRGRAWYSPPGGLWLSVLLRPPAASVEVISLRAGLAVAEAMELLSIRLELKWPNDFMLAGRKAGGVLCEARWQGDALGWTAVGVGMNVRNHIPSDLRSSAASLMDVRPEITVEKVAEPVLRALRSLDLGAARLLPSEMGSFAARDWLKGRRIREPLAGTVAGLGEDGSLLVRPAGGPEVAVRNGPVELAAVSHSR